MSKCKSCGQTEFFTVDCKECEDLSEKIDKETKSWFK